VQAIVKTAPGYGNLELREWPDPAPRAGQVVVRLERGGVCSTDVAVFAGTYRGRRPLQYPSMLGHEAAGVVVATGDEVDGVEVGDRVALQVIWGRPHSRQSLLGFENVDADWRHLGASDLGGTFAECIAVRADRVFLVPDVLDWDRAALLEPLAVACHAVELVGLRPGETFAAVGPGPFALLMTLVAQVAGAATAVVVGLRGVDAARLAVARSLGAQTLEFDGGPAEVEAAVRDLTDGAGADVVMDCGGTPESLPLALDLAAQPGRVGVFGFAPEARIEPMRQIVRKGLTLSGIAAARRSHYHDALRLMASGLVDPTRIVTHRVPWRRVEEGLELARSRAAAKVLIDP
jgi:L-iditol 2-dehydrogenase